MRIFALGVQMSGATDWGDGDVEHDRPPNRAVPEPAFGRGVRREHEKELALAIVVDVLLPARVQDTGITAREARAAA